MHETNRVPAFRPLDALPPLGVAVVTLLGLMAGATHEATAAFTFPASCIAYPQDCAGSNVPGGRYGTNGLGDSPRAVVAGVDTGEVILARVTMDLASYPNAVCNDGSPAVFYFATAPAGSVNEHRWVIQLEGGGGCLPATDEASLHSDCMDRWTGKGPDLLDVPRKMSTDLDGNGTTDSFLPMRGKLPGLLGYDSVVTDPSSDGGSNAWNRVFINYCSSDLWTGQSGSISLTGGSWNHPIGGPQLYEPLASTYFHGHLIIESVLDAIEAGVSSDDGGEQIALSQPPEQLVLAGESAGGAGVLANLDWLAGKLSWGADALGDRGITLGVAGATTHPPFAYDDAFIPWWQGPAIVQEWDGTFTAGSPTFVDADADGNGVTDTHVAEQGAANRRFLYQNLIDAFVDETCLARPPVAGLPDPDQRDWICYRGSEVVPSGDITTPVLIKQDLNDHLIKGVTPAFPQGVVATFDTLSPNASYFGPDCGRHETLSSSGHFHGDQILDPPDRLVSYHSAIADFIAGSYESIHHTPGVTTAICSPIPPLPPAVPSISQRGMGALLVTIAAMGIAALRGGPLPLRATARTRRQRRELPRRLSGSGADGA